LNGYPEFGTATRRLWAKDYEGMQDRHDPVPSRRLGAAKQQLDDATDRLAGHVLALDESREVCTQVAERYDDFAQRMAPGYPSLAGPARRLAELLRDLDIALGRLSTSTERLVAASGQVADAVAT
jgi:hypothetical protein